MSKNVRLIITLLFGFILIFVAGITRFLTDNSKNTENIHHSSEIHHRISSDEKGNRIFENINHLYGISDKSDRVIVNPEFTQLSFASDNFCIASKPVGSKILTGCIDYERNIVVPFIYKSITQYSADDSIFYIAEADSDGSLAVYSENFAPCFMRSWSGFKTEGNSVVLKNKRNSFTYSLRENRFICTKAELSNSALMCGFRLKVESRLLLSQLSSLSLEKISEFTSDYLEYAFTDSTELLTRVSKPEKFKKLFPDERSIISKKLKNIQSAYIYSEKDDFGEQVFVVSVTADTDIKYRAEDKTIKNFSGSYRTLLRFKPSVPDITPVSAAFELSAPVYPDKNSAEIQ